MKASIRKRIFGIIAAIVCAAAFCVTLSFTACAGEEKDILVIAREDGSGTRDAFDSLIVKDGVTLKNSEMVSSVELLSKTGDVITKVSSVSGSIGYISLGSLNNTVKALKIGGVEATSANVKSDTYKLWRPFVVMTNKTITEAGTLTVATKDFISYLNSTAAETISTAEYVPVGLTGTYTAPAEAVSGTVIIRGSTSVEPLMGKLIAGYQSAGGAKVSGVNFDMQCQGSSHGLSAAKENTAVNVIGLSSSAIKAGDASSLSYFNIALDAISVIVNKSNTLTDVSVENLYDIYTGSVTRFSALTAA